MITGINESKTLTNYISCECKFDGEKCNSNQWWNNDKCQCESTKYIFIFIFGILLHVAVKMENIEQVLWMIRELRVMKLLSHTVKTWKLGCTMKQILMKRKQPVKCKIFTFYLHFY